jgi:signal transduction histidine kinase/CheY-like chemotaxis protein
MLVPLLVRGNTIGVMSFCYSDSGRHYTNIELELAQELARRAATAVDNARLYREAQEALLRRDESLEARLALERKMLETQKLESLGVLAGGIAHDFNNLLTVIIGNATLALLDLDSQSQAGESVEQIQVAARRAADLTRQMLTYAGRGRVTTEPLNLNHMLREMSLLLRSSISKDVQLREYLSPQPLWFEGDATQIRQVLMNLIINASEALGSDGGSMSIATTLLHADQAYLDQTYAAADLPEGVYVVLQVADTGCGMDKPTQARIFDPFFTTKFTGRGLGLAAVLGIVRGHGGTLHVQSEPGKGSVFTVLFPALPDDQLTNRSPAEAPAPPTAPRSHHGLVLVVDDEDDVAATAARMLSTLGFEVLLAADGIAGLELFREHAPRLQVVLLDLTMPRMSGEETLHAMRQVSGDVPIVLMSGYSEEDIASRFARNQPAGFLQKPFTHQELQALLAIVLAQ